MLCQIFQTSANWRFFGYDFAIEHGFSPEDYHLVYECDVDDTYNPEDAFYEFNQRRPDDYRAPSLSVSDIVVLDGTAHYCDSFGFHKLSENQVPVPAENTWTFYKDENENNNEDADEWPFGVLRLCADKFHVIGCATNDSCNEYRCFFQSLDEGQDAFYVEGQACDDPYEAYYELMQQETPALEDYEDIFAVYPVSDMYFMALSLAENNLWN